MPFSFTDGPIPGLKIITPRRFTDERGFFLETYKTGDFSAHGIPGLFVQDNHSRSKRGVLRGLHFQRPPHAQGKLVRVVRGRVWDVAVDLRPDSVTFGKWSGLELSDDNKVMFYVPPGFAHGFVALEDGTDFLYKCTDVYAPECESGIRYDDPDLGIEWPMENCIVNEKDLDLPSFKEFQDGST
ncbi:MAG: dTDP-4-dehydrorhamnose 3,5-epimerase [Spirochaetia bacterium]